MWSNEEGKQPYKRHIKNVQSPGPSVQIKSIKGPLVRSLFSIPNPGPVCFVPFPNSGAGPGRLDTDPSPRIHTAGLRIRIRILLFCGFQDVNSTNFFLVFTFLGTFSSNFKL
jgi:hypothetical protein